MFSPPTYTWVVWERGLWKQEGVGPEKHELKARDTHGRATQGRTPENCNLEKVSLNVRSLGREIYALFPVKVGCFPIIGAERERFKVEDW